MKSSIHRANAFLRTVARSVVDVRFYRALSHKRPGEAAGYLAVLLTLCWMVPFAISFFIGARTLLDGLNRDLRRHLPPDAVFEFKDGKMSTNLAAPIVVRDDGAAFIVNTATTTLGLDDGEIGLVVNSDGIFQRKGPDDVENVDFKSAPDTRLTKADLDRAFGRLAPVVVFVTALLSLLMAAVLFSASIALLVAANGLLLWLAMKALKRPFDRSTVLVIAAYAASAPIMAKAIFFWSGVDAGIIPLVLYWILLGAIAYELRKPGPPPAPEKTEDKTETPR
jgi:hypothetical protein